jgi:hypothetical protein
MKSPATGLWALFKQRIFPETDGTCSQTNQSRNSQHAVVVSNLSIGGDREQSPSVATQTHIGDNLSTATATALTNLHLLPNRPLPARSTDPTAELAHQVDCPVEGKATVEIVIEPEKPYNESEENSNKNEDELPLDGSPAVNAVRLAINSSRYFLPTREREPSCAIEEV